MKKIILILAIVALFGAIKVYADEPISGCMNPRGTNYNPLATIDDGSCLILGCMNKSAYNYDKEATVSDSSCKIHGGADPMSIGQMSFNGLSGYEIMRKFVMVMPGQSIVENGITSICPIFFSSPCWSHTAI